MKKLKGALRLYFKQDIIFTIVLIIGTLVMALLQYSEFKNKGVADISIVDIMFNYFVIMLNFDYSFSFAQRFIIHSNFSSSRKLFFNTTIITILAKSFILAFFQTLLMKGYEVLLETNEIKFSINMFGSNYSNITFTQGVFICITFLILIFTMYSLSIFVSAAVVLIAKKYILLIFCSIITVILDSILLISFFKINYATIYYYIFYLSVVIVNIILLKAFWFIIKKQSIIEDSRLLMLSGAYGQIK